MEEHERVERFLGAYNSIDKALRRRAGVDQRVEFSAVIRRAAESSSLLRRYRDDLKEYHDLRNAIVHESTTAEAIAVPREDTVIKIEALEKHINRPRDALSLATRPVETLEANSDLTTAARMMAEGHFSQIPIYEEGKYRALLTSDLIAWWMGRTSGFSSTPRPAEVKVGQMLQDEKQTGTCRFVARSATVADALEQFEASCHNGTRLDAVIITQSGNERETPLGIITPWDLAKVYAALAL